MRRSRPPPLLAIGNGPSWLYGENAYIALQTRLPTATDTFLDLAASDYLGSFPRRLNEPDAAYSLRIRREIIRPRNTRAAIIQVLQDLTGNTPTVFRPSNAADTGGWGSGGIALGEFYQGIVNPWAVTTAIAPPYTGSTVYQHAAVLSG